MNIKKTFIAPIRYVSFQNEDKLIGNRRKFKKLIEEEGMHITLDWLDRLPVAYLENLAFKTLDSVNLVIYTLLEL